MKVALQLYTLRDETARDFPGTLRKVAELGYEGVEFAGYGGLEAAELKRQLAELGLEAAGSHIAFDRLLTALDEEIAFNRTIGNRYLVVPAMNRELSASPEGWLRAFEQLERIGRRCAEEGMVLCYHNHHMEFEMRIGDAPVFDAMFERVSAEALQVELDACWAHRAGYDPVSCIRRYAGRLPLVHFKDMVRTEDGGAETVELGQGEVRLAEIAKAAAEAKVEWLIVEQDECLRNAPLVCAANNLEWLKQYERQGGPARARANG